MKQKNYLFQKYKLGLLNMMIVFTMLTGSVSLYAQNQVTVTGSIKDSQGGVLIGAGVLERGTANGTVTDVNGNYTITVGGNSTLVATYVGFTRQEIPVNGRTNIPIVLAEEVEVLGQVVVVGYGVKRKETLTGAISSLKGSELITVKNENVQNMLTGKIPGVRVWQRSSEPGAYDNRFDIRGYSVGTGTNNNVGSPPLVIIDGVPRTMDEFQRLSPNDIDDISVLKDGSAAIYGIRAANGVVLVTTKKGAKSEKSEISYSSSFSFQFPSGMPDVVNATEYMDRRNWNNQRNTSWPRVPIYSEQDYTDYQNGTKKSWDWNEYILKELVPETQHNLSVTGGSDRTTYYIGAGYLYQNSIFKTNDRNYHKYNLLSNISTKIYDNLTFDLQVSAIVDERNEPNEDANWIIRDYWRMNPLYNQGPYADVEETMFNAGVTERENPYTMLYSENIGSRKREKRWFDGTASLKYDVPYLKGLSIKGLFGYNFNFENYKVMQREFTQYTYGEVNGVPTYTPSIYPRNSTPRVTDRHYLKTQMLSQFILNYDNVFMSNRIGATLVWESQWRRGTNFRAQRDLAFPVEYLSAGMTTNQIGDMDIDQNHFYIKNNNGLAGRFNYSFADKYLAEFLFRYDGSSMFAPGYQWGFFPGGSLGWRISEEDFFKNSSLGFIHQLKLRASYATTGDDAASTYQFMTGYNYPVNSGDNGRRAPGGYVLNGVYTNSASNRGLANERITWYTAKTFNLGVDFEAWKGLFGFTFEYFNREREGLLATRTGGIPTVIGAELPQENLNSDRHFGLELELTHRQQIDDFFYRVSLMGTVARRKMLYREEREFNSSWDKYRNSESNRLQGRWRGFEYLGRFQSWEEIWNYPANRDRNTLPGDYYYLDWNGDGEFNDNDQYYARFSGDTPLMNYSLNFSAAYKRFDFSLLFQGSAGGSIEYGEQVRGDDAQTLRMFLDQWHPVNFTDDPYDPTTQWVNGYYSFNNGSRRDNSTFNVENVAYLRLKNIELGYNLPQVKHFNARLYVSGYNVFTLTAVKNVDPEHPRDGYGFMYPLNKMLTFGFTVKF